MKRLFPAVLSLLLTGVSWAGHRPIVIPDDYDHDKWNTEPDDAIRKFAAFTTSFDTDDDDSGDGEPDLWGIPQWVAYHIKAFDGSPMSAMRPGWFTDEELKSRGFAPGDNTYKYSRAFRKEHPNWYVRGHLCMKNHAARISPEAEWNTHTMLNAVPQRQRFNAGIWHDLEYQTGRWADLYGEVWIIAGPVVDLDEPPALLGERHNEEMLIAIPDALFKIVVRKSSVENRPDVLAFIYPQEDEGYEGSPYDHTKYLVSVDEIEEATGLDFFTSLLEADQTAIERASAPSLWGSLERVIGRTRMLLRYLAVNAKLEQQDGPVDPVPLYSAPDPEEPDTTLESDALEPVVTQEEFIDLLGKFSVNPPRYPKRSWPQPPSSRPRQYIDQQLSMIASEILTSLSVLADKDDGELMWKVDRLRNSEFLLHLSKIDRIAQLALLHHVDSVFPVVGILEPGFLGVSRESIEHLFELTDFYRVPEEAPPIWTPPSAVQDN